MGSPVHRRIVVAAGAVFAALALGSEGLGGPVASGPAGALTGTDGALPDRAPDPSLSSRVGDARRNDDVAWEANRGQCHPAVRFAAHARRYSAFLTDRDLTFAFRFRAGDSNLETVVPVRMRLVGGATGEFRVEDERPGVSNYLRGDASRWVTGVKSWGTVRRVGALAGIDMLLRGVDGAVEYAFEVAPSADPASIGMVFEGVSGVSSTSSGDLLLRTVAGDVLHRDLRAFQEGASGRRPVPARFHVRADGAVGFSLGAYDRTRPLVIDPVVSPVTLEGGDLDNDEMYAGALGNSGDIYLAGYAAQADYPVTGGAFQTTHAGVRDGVITRLNPTATARVFATYLGGTLLDEIRALHVSANGIVAVAGRTDSGDFPGTTAGFSATDPSVTSIDAFLAVLNASGSTVLYATYIGGDGVEIAHGVWMNSLGIAAVAGTRGADAGGTFPFTQSPLGAADPDDSDGFVVTVDTNASGAASLLDAAPVVDNNGAGNQALLACHIDESNVVTVCGSTTSDITATNPATGGYVAGTDGIVVQFSDETLATVGFADHVGGDAIDECAALRFVGGLIYLTGTSNSTASFPLVNPLYTPRGGGDTFVTVLDPGGASVDFSTMWGGSNNESGIAIDVDLDGSIHVTGTTDTDNSSGPFLLLPLSGDAVDTTYNGGASDAYVLKIGTPLSSPVLTYASYLGGSGTDTGRAVAADAGGGTLTSGTTDSGDFPTTAGVVKTTAGNRDGFAAFTITQTLALRPDFAHVTDAFAAFADKFKIDGDFTYTANATNTSFDPTQDDMTVTMVHNGETHQLVIPAGDTRWKNKGGGLYKITRPETTPTSPKWTVCFNAIAKTFTVTKTKFDYADIPDPVLPVVLSIDITSGGGNNDGTVARIFKEGSFNTLKNEIVLRYNE